MPRLLSCVLAILLATSLVPPARANDSSAEFEMGALRFKKDPDIAMQAEDLAISTARIRIVYRFLNRSNADKTIMVAFPMPDIVGADSNENIAVPTEDPDNLFDFKVSADGMSVPLRLEQHAFANGIDQIALLRRMHIPLMPLAAATNEALDKLSTADRANFLKLGLGRIETYGTGGPMVDHLEANWTLRTAFTWMQTFPAGREITLEQSYQPSVGGSAQTFIGSDDWRQIPEAKDYVRKFCIDPGFIRTVERVRAEKGAAYPTFGEQRIAYILKTGANWAGPIGDFHLAVDKGAVANLVSFCADGVRKTGPTRFEAHAKDFVPIRDLYILILMPLQ